MLKKGYIGLSRKKGFQMLFLRDVKSGVLGA